MNTLFLALFFLLSLIFLGSEVFSQSIEAHTPQAYGEPSLVPFQIIFKDKTPYLEFDASPDLIEVISDAPEDYVSVPPSLHYQIPLGEYHRVFLRTPVGVTSLIFSYRKKEAIVLVNGKATAQYSHRRERDDLYEYDVDYYRDRLEWAYTPLDY